LNTFINEKLLKAALIGPGTAALSFCTGWVFKNPLDV
jgi:hypothetical protein